MENGFYICPEMEKLRDELSKRNITWSDNSDKGFCGFWICRTHFEYKRHSWSVVHGFGTFGGFCTGGSDLQALECMCDAINNGDPVGYLTALDVLKHMESVKDGD